MTRNAICLCVDRRMAIPALFVACSIAAYSGAARNEHDIVIVTPPGELDEAYRTFAGERGIRIDDTVGLAPIADIRIRQKRLSPATLVRLLLAGHYRDVYDRILYLDADLTIHCDVSVLFSIDMGRHAVAAVPSGRVLSDLSDAEIDRIVSHFAALGMTPPYRYFNTGIMLIDTGTWIADRIAERTLAFLRENPEHCILPDEDALNAVLDGNILELSTIWNSWPHQVRPGSEELAIVHYAGPNKPWKRFGRHERLAMHRFAYAQYREFLRGTPWSGFLRSQWEMRDLLPSAFHRIKRPVLSLLKKASPQRRRRQRKFLEDLKLFDATVRYADIEQGITVRQGGRIALSPDGSGQEPAR